MSFIHIPDNRPEYDVKLLSPLSTHSMHSDLEQVQQEDALWPWLNDNSGQIMQQLDENYNVDLLDAWADLAYQQEQAMREEMQPPTQPEELTYDNSTKT